MSNSKHPEPKPGEVLQGRNWTATELEQMREFIETKEPGLWEQLVEVERTTEDFTDLNITFRVKQLIREKFPEAGRLGHMQMFGALRRIWQKS